MLMNWPNQVRSCVLGSSCFVYSYIYRRFRSLACDGVFSGLGIADSMDCVCEAELIHGFSNMVADIDCVTTAQSCVSSDVTDFCGGVALTASVGGGADKQLNGNFTTCLAASMPEDLGDVSLCVSAMSDASTPGVGFDSCTASMNFMACDCTPCGDAGTDFAFTFDCTMVDLSPFKGIPIYGPKIDTCQLLNFQYTV